MPAYEMPLIIKKLTRPEVATILKRTAMTILEKGGVIQKVENLGTHRTPYKIRQHGVVLKEASYFLIEFDSSPAALKDILDNTIRDIDIMRCRIFKTSTPEEFECTLENECLPPMYRKDVQEMLKKSNRFVKQKFESNSGLDYYPFNK